MQWDASPNAGGFTSEIAKPWMRVHDNYPTLNVKRQTRDPNFVFNFWHELLVCDTRTRSCLHRGFLPMLIPYMRHFLSIKKRSDEGKLVVTLNFIEEKQSIYLTGHLASASYKTLVKNYEEDSLGALQAYEGGVYLEGK